MTEVISIRFKNKGKVYYFDPAGIQVQSGDNVVVETAQGAEYAWCSEGNHMVEDAAVVQPLRPVIRIATEADTARFNENQKKETDAFAICEEKIAKHGMDMKLVDVEYSFDGSKILFFFTSDGRVDFRDLVKDLASVFKTRIELRQIGVRDEARMLGGLGICGRPFCCNQFLDEFHPVSIKMAKTQGLSLNPTKISGACGRLMCCLKYEQTAYEDLIKKAPKIDSFVDTTAGKGSVVSVNLLRSNAKVRLEDSGDTTLRSFSFDDLEVLGGKTRRAEYIAAKAEGRLEEAGFKPSPKPKEAPVPEIKFIDDPEALLKYDPKSSNTQDTVHEDRPEHRGKSGEQKQDRSQRNQRSQSRRGKNNVKRAPKPKTDTAENKESSPAKESRPPQSKSKRPSHKRSKPAAQKQEPQKQQQTHEQPSKDASAPAKKNNRRRYYRSKKPSGAAPKES